MLPVGESPQISGPVVLIILVVLALALAAAGVTIWQGCVMAVRAGRGDRRALRIWVAIAVVEAWVGWSGLILLFGPGLALQAALYLWARSTKPPPEVRPGPANPPSGS